MDSFENQWKNIEHYTKDMWEIANLYVSNLRYQVNSLRDLKNKKTIRKIAMDHATTQLFFAKEMLKANKDFSMHLYGRELTMDLRPWPQNIRDPRFGSLYRLRLHVPGEIDTLITCLDNLNITLLGKNYDMQRKILFRIPDSKKCGEVPIQNIHLDLLDQQPFERETEKGQEYVYGLKTTFASYLHILKPINSGVSMGTLYEIMLDCESENPTRAYVRIHKEQTPKLYNADIELYGRGYEFFVDSAETIDKALDISSRLRFVKKRGRKKCQDK